MSRQRFHAGLINPSLFSPGFSFSSVDSAGGINSRKCCLPDSNLSVQVIPFLLLIVHPFGNTYVLSCAVWAENGGLHSNKPCFFGLAPPTYYGVSRPLRQALWLTANLPPSLLRLLGCRLHVLMNKFSQLPLTSEVTTASKLRAAIHSTGICTERSAPCSKAAPAGASQPQVALRTMLSLSREPCCLSPSLEVDLLVSLLCLWCWPSSRHWPSSVTHWLHALGRRCPSLTQVNYWLLHLWHTPPLPEQHELALQHCTQDYVPISSQGLTGREQIQVLRHVFPFTLKTIVIEQLCVFILFFLEMGSFLEAPYSADSQICLNKPDHWFRLGWDYPVLYLHPAQIPVC